MQAVIAGLIAGVAVGSVVWAVTVAVLRRRWFPSGNHSVTYAADGEGKRRRKRYVLRPKSIHRLFEPVSSNHSDAHKTNELVVRPGHSSAEILIIDEEGIAEYTELSDGPREDDIYLGEVVDVRPGLNAAFVEIGEKRNALVEIDQQPISDLSAGDRLVCQLTGLPRGNKGFSGRDRLVLDGWYLTIEQGASTRAVGRLHDHVRGSDPGRLGWELSRRCEERNVGLYIHEELGSPDEKAYFKDLGSLLQKLAEYERAVKDPRLDAPARLQHKDPYEVALDMTQSVLEATPVPFRFVTVVGGWNSRFVSDFEARQKRYPNSVLASARFRHNCPYRKEHIEKPLDTVRNGLSARSVKLECPSGGSLIIEETAAFTAVDVNSGSARKSNGETTEEFIQRINLEASAVLARALRLLNIGGAILIDYISFDSKDPSVAAASRANLRRNLEDQLCENLPLLTGPNPPKTEVGETSPVAGVLDMTRQRNGYSLWQEIRSKERHGR